MLFLATNLKGNTVETKLNCAAPKGPLCFAVAVAVAVAVALPLSGPSEASDPPFVILII